MASIIVSYDLNPPSTVKSSLQSSNTQHFPIDSSLPKDTQDQSKQYYAALAKTIKDAQVAIGHELTMWRDAVGTAENPKETKVPKNEEEEEEDMDDENDQ